MELESLLEQYYYKAFRITELLQELTGRTRSHCIEITMARSHLVEHPQDAADYTFGLDRKGQLAAQSSAGHRRGTAPAWFQTP